MFGDRLKKLRISKKLRQIDMAEKLGIARTTYAMYEQGMREPDYDTLKKLADFFDVTVDYLLTGRTETTSHELNDLSPEDLEILEKIKSDPNLNLFFKDFASAPEEHQRDLIKIWKALHGDKEGK
jgi:transcriptional regulator with XRE-family HTH domain